MEITLWTSDCMGLCNSHVFRVSNSDEYAIEHGLGWSLELSIFHSITIFDTACHSECSAFMHSIFSPPSLSGSCGWRRAAEGEGLSCTEWEQSHEAGELLGSEVNGSCLILLNSKCPSSEKTTRSQLKHKLYCINQCLTHWSMVGISGALQLVLYISTANQEPPLSSTSVVIILNLCIFF